MPLYGVAQSGSNATPGLNLTAVMPGDNFTLFNAEQVTAPQASVAFSRAMSVSDSDQGVTFSIRWAAQPTAVVQIQGANEDLEAAYQTLYTSENAQLDSFTDPNRYAFYRAKLVTGGDADHGGLLSVIAQR